MNNRLMKSLINLKVIKDQKGQDLIEYALMAGFVALAAASIFPAISASINVVFSKVNSVMTGAAAS